MLQEPTRTESIFIQNSSHLIFEPESDCKKLLIIFAYINQKLGTRSHSSFLRNINCKKLFLNPGLNEWYQTGVPGVASSYSGLLAFIRDVKSNFADHEILCLGHSMGGFPALGIGVSIGADRILAKQSEHTALERYADRVRGLNFYTVLKLQKLNHCPGREAECI
jgi:hypothetical protein